MTTDLDLRYRVNVVICKVSVPKTVNMPKRSAKEIHNIREFEQEIGMESLATKVHSRTSI